MVPERLPAVINYSILASKRIFRILTIAVVLGGGGYIIYSIIDFSFQNMAISLIIFAAMSAFAYSELSIVTAKLRLEPDAFIFTTLFVEMRIPFSTVKGFVPYFFGGGTSGFVEWNGIQLVREKGMRISIHDQFNDYVLLKDWVKSNFVNLKGAIK